MRYLFCLLFLAPVVGATAQSNQWTEKNAIGQATNTFPARQDAVSFSIGSKGYVATGSDGSRMYNDLWEYDPATGAWTQKASLSNARYSATAFVLGGKAYVGLGRTCNNCFYSSAFAKDLNEYDPVTNTWTSKAAFPGNARQAAASFAVGTKGYVGGGYSLSACGTSTYADFYEYDPSTNAWTSKAGLPVARAMLTGFGLSSKGYICSWDATNTRNDLYEYDPAANTWAGKATFTGSMTGALVSFAANSKGYVGLGTGNATALWEYTPGSNSWATRATFTGTGRTSPFAFVINNVAYVGAGSNQKSDLYSYTASSNSWATLSAAASGRLGAVSFTANGKLYTGTGNTGSAVLKDFWEWDPATNVWTQKADFPGVARWNAAAFSINNKGYVGTGNSATGGGSSTTLKDFYEYNPSTNTWTQKTDCPASTSEAMATAIGDKGYLTGGVTYATNFYQYDPSANTWTQKAAFSGSGRNGGVAFSIGGRGYFGLGRYFNNSTGQYDFSNTFMQYNPESNTWSYNSGVIDESLNSIYRYGGAAFVVGGRAYITQGFYTVTGYNGCASVSNSGFCGQTCNSVSNYTYSTYWDDLFEFDPIAVTWTRKPNTANQTSTAGNTVIYGRRGPTAVGIGTKGYVLGGLGGTYRTENLEYAPAGVFTNSLSLAALCAGSNGTVSYSSNETFTAGNTFSVQISKDRFSSTTTIGTLSSTSATGSINVSVPSDIAEGTYYVRIVSSAPATVGPAYEYSLTARTAPAASISYAQSAYCASSAAATPTTQGSAGSFSATPSGLSINAANGQVNFSLSTPGTYAVAYTIPGNECFAPTVISVPLTVTATPSASISYSGSPYCSSAGTGAVLQSGTAGGSFSATPGGLDLDAASGSINPAASQPGNYTVTYTVAAAGGCSAISATAAVAVDAAPAAGISYTGTPYCASTGNVPVTLTGTAGGSFQSTAGLSLDAATGMINTSASVPGTYTVTYTVPASGNCPSISSQAILAISSAAAATFSYSAASFCQNSGNHSVTRNGTAGGSFSAAPAGLSIDAATGMVNTNSSQPGTYTVSYTIPAANGCSSVTASTQLVINEAFSASIGYTGTPYCASSGSVPVFLSGSNGGSFSALPTGLSLNTQTGAIDLALSASGSYTVSYGTGTGCGAAATTQVDIRPVNGAGSLANLTYCPNVANTAPAFSVLPGITLNWTNSNPSIGLPASGTGNLPLFVAQNESSAAVYAYITMNASGGSGCSFKAQGFRITIQPNPVLNNPMPDAGICAGTAISAVTFSGPVPGTLFSWSNSNTAIGLPASGSGTVPAFTARNNTGSSLQATITVTPSANGCYGSTTAYTYTVAPSAGSISYPQSAYCPSSWAYVARSGSAGGSFSATPAGLALGGTDGAINLAASLPGTYTITYTIGSPGICNNSASTTLTVLPMATVTPMANQVFCSGVPSPSLAFSGTASGFSWVNDNPSIGLAASGAGASLPSFVPVNPGPGQVYGYIKVSPLGGAGSNCPGKPIAFRITVNPCGPVTGSSAPGGSSQTLRAALTLQPNPVASDVLHIGYSGASKRLSVEIRDERGITVKKDLQLSPGSTTLAVGLLRPGGYYVVVNDPQSGAQASLPFIKL